MTTADTSNDKRGTLAGDLETSVVILTVIYAAFLVAMITLNVGTF
ncbi:MAG: hypothetical protein AAAFM81_07530 [Pseudomonadota bacterium]